jgi:flagellar biosynthesis protein FlhF
MTQFESFSYQSVVLTKLDETSRIGNLVSAIASRGIPLSYLTDGQTVPLDIAVASPMRLLSRLKGLDYDRTELEERYPADDLTAAWR